MTFSEHKHTSLLIESCEVNYSKMLTRSERTEEMRGAAAKQLSVSQNCKTGQATEEGKTGVKQGEMRDLRSK